MRATRPRQPSDPAGEAEGVWSFGDEGLVQVEATGQSIVLVPSERVLTLVADLPPLSRAEKQAAAPFAVEEEIADSLESVHVALGAELQPNRHLIGVVRHELMHEWILSAAAAGIRRAAFAPDYLRLPIPPEGGWSVEAGSDRVLVRTFEGPGFAVPPADLSAAWKLAGRPPIVRQAGELPDGVVGEEPGLGLASTVRPTPLPPWLDLRQGPYAPRGRPEYTLLRRLAAVAVIGLAIHTMIFAVDATALRRMAENRRAELAVLAGRAAPGAAFDGDLVAELEPLLARRGEATRSRFLALFNRSAAALRPLSPALVYRAVAFTADGALTLDLQAGSVAGLQQAQAALAGAGLTVVAGATDTRDGYAAGRLTVREAGG